MARPAGACPRPCGGPGSSGEKAAGRKPARAPSRRRKAAAARRDRCDRTGVGQHGRLRRCLGASTRLLGPRLGGGARATRAGRARERAPRARCARRGSAGGRGGRRRRSRRRSPRRRAACGGGRRRHRARCGRGGLRRRRDRCRRPPRGARRREPRACRHRFAGQARGTRLGGAQLQAHGGRGPAAGKRGGHCWRRDRRQRGRRR